MRLSLTIAATFAAIAGCVVATHGPLHARALDQVDPFERDEVYIYSRSDHRHLHQLAAEKLELAICATKLAIDDTKHASNRGFPRQRQRWLDEHARLSHLLPELQRMQRAHSNAAKNNHRTHLLYDVDWLWGYADKIAKDGHLLSRDAQRAVTDYGHQNAAFEALVSADRLVSQAIALTQNVIELTVGRQIAMWTDRLAELRKMGSWLKELHQSYSNKKEHPWVGQYSEGVAGHATAISKEARSLGNLAWRAVRRRQNQLRCQPSSSRVTRCDCFVTPSIQIW